MDIAIFDISLEPLEQQSLFSYNWIDNLNLYSVFLLDGSIASLERTNPNQMGLLGSQL